MAGPQQPDYKPRTPGIGAQARRMDMTDGRGVGPKNDALTGAPTTGVEAPYGQRSELLGLQGDAPLASPGNRAPARFDTKSLPELGAEPPEEPLPPMAPVPEALLAAYTDADDGALAEILPDLVQLAAQPEATPAMIALAEQAAEIMLHRAATARPTRGFMAPLYEG